MLSRLLFFIILVLGCYSEEQEGGVASEDAEIKVTAENVADVDWCQVDRRADEGWWHLYPFGERYHDVDLVWTPWDHYQIDLDFFVPFYGFRFNYTFILTEGFVTFSYPYYIQPPYTFPNSRWPEQPDPSFIAAFLQPQQKMTIGDIPISHIWRRIIYRPPNLIGVEKDISDRRAIFGSDNFGGGVESSATSCPSNRPTYDGQTLRIQDGRVEDPAFLDQLSRDIGKAMVGTRGFTADYALLVTWERMAYGGAPKYVDLKFYDQVKRWQNTYQMVLATDEVRSYTMFNYANINWTSSTSAGALFGQGGKQSALVGFNGGNGTGLYELPYSGERNAYKLVQLGSTQTAGRWIARTDEHPVYGGCVNTTIVQPGQQPERSPLRLINDPIQLEDNWRSIEAKNLTLEWSAKNISTNPNAQVDITLWGYWETMHSFEFKQIGAIALYVRNSGRYSFNPRTLVKANKVPDSWKNFWGGVVQVRVASENWVNDDGDGLYWSKLTPFGWYFREEWTAEYGSRWAEQLCGKWFKEKNRTSRMKRQELRIRPHFLLELNEKISCPCTLDQALLDFGRFVALPQCDMFGNTECSLTRGAKHCVLSAQRTWDAAGQTCCYDHSGWLMFSNDYEWNSDFLRFYSAGVPVRAHPWGSFPWRRPPHVPSLSTFYNDVMPYQVCCKWAGKCEYYFWRRPTSECQNYRHSVNGFAYGQGHFVTYDGLKFPFQGKGYFVLSEKKGLLYDMNIHVRMEQPPKTMWDTDVPATVITGVAAKDNGSDTVQVFARKEFRRWRYKIDVYVGRERIYFDKQFKKIQIFRGVTVTNQARNMNMSQVTIVFDTGVGITVRESSGMLQVQVALPFNYNETNEVRAQKFGHTTGLLGTFNEEPGDDLMIPDGTLIRVNTTGPIGKEDAATIYRKFGEKWRVDYNRDRLLFDTRFRPLYDPRSFAVGKYVPQFDPFQESNTSSWPSLMFTEEQVKTRCWGVLSCMYDYITSGRRNIGVETLQAETKFIGFKSRGEKELKSCGNLMKNPNVIKYPPGDSYLDGRTVTFACKPDYILHGTESRDCVNGTWSPGWWVWCSKRGGSREAWPMYRCKLDGKVLPLNKLITHLEKVHSVSMENAQEPTHYYELLFEEGDPTVDVDSVVDTVGVDLWMWSDGLRMQGGSNSAEVALKGEIMGL